VGLRHAIAVALASVWIGTAGASAGESAAPLPQSGPRASRGAIELTVPVTEAGVYIGDIKMQIKADGGMETPSARLLDLLALVAKPELVAAVRKKLADSAWVSLEVLAESGIAMRYDSQKIELALDIPLPLQLARRIDVSARSGSPPGDFAAPATFSGYLNMRGALAYAEAGDTRGILPPVIFLDGATRFHDFELEAQGSAQPGGPGAAFQRQATRLEYDDQDNIIRWTLGDLETTARGFQSAPYIAGLSLYRSYGVLQPQTIARPSGQQGFTLSRASTVEIWINGQLLQRIQLGPGQYDLRNFPFTQGVQDVRLSIRDDSGGIQELNFSQFSDQAQLAEGLTEFGLYAGVRAPLGASGPGYTGDPEVTGYIEHGLSERLTLGANLQANVHSAMGGADAILSTGFGSFSASLAASKGKALGYGYAALLDFHTMFGGTNGTADTLDLSAEMWSRDFSPVDAQSALGAVLPMGISGTVPVPACQNRGPAAPAGSLAASCQTPAPSFSPGVMPPPLNPYVYEFNGSYSHVFNDGLYAGISLHYAKGRAPSPDSDLYEVTLGWHPTSFASLNATAGYQRSIFDTHGGLLVQLSLTLQLDQDSSVIASADSALGAERLEWMENHGSDAGSYNASAALERTSAGYDLDGTVNYVGSAGEVGADHFSAFGGSGLQSVAQTDVRVATSIAFADGAVSVGRPISDAFAIVQRSKNLENADVVIDPGPSGYEAQTGPLGTATVPDLASYNERTVSIDAPDAPVDSDIGQDTFRLLPPHRAGYRLEAGTDYSITAIGRLVNENGEPLPLVSGSASEIGNPSHKPIELFTNAQGRFGLTGLRAGRWRIEMQTEPATDYEIDVAAGSKGAVTLGDVRPARMAGQP